MLDAVRIWSSNTLVPIDPVIYEKAKQLCALVLAKKSSETSTRPNDSLTKSMDGKLEVPSKIRDSSPNERISEGELSLESELAPKEKKSAERRKKRSVDVSEEIVSHSDSPSDEKTYNDSPSDSPVVKSEDSESQGTPEVHVKRRTKPRRSRTDLHRANRAHQSTNSLLTDYTPTPPSFVPPPAEGSFKVIVNPLFGQNVPIVTSSPHALRTVTNPLYGASLPRPSPLKPASSFSSTPSSLSPPSSGHLSFSSTPFSSSFPSSSSLHSGLSSPSVPTLQISSVSQSPSVMSFRKHNVNRKTISFGTKEDLSEVSETFIFSSENHFFDSFSFQISILTLHYESLAVAVTHFHLDVTFHWFW